MSLTEIVMTIYQRCEDLKSVGETEISVDMVQFIIEDGLRRLNDARRSSEVSKEAK
jgi:hypothetical protein